MIEYENECVDCPKEIGCFGNSCPMLHVPHFYCDECDEEVDQLYYYNGEELCIDCVKELLEKVMP